jgi:hypothetical protein
MSLFERWLTLWVALGILAGFVLGSPAPGLFGALAALEVAPANLVVAVLIWAMVYPMMIAVDLGSLKAVGKRPMGLTAPDVSDDAFLDAMTRHPILVNRPIVCTPKGVRRCRPSETVLDLLDKHPPGPLAKEDGQLIIDAEGNRIA